MREVQEGVPIEKAEFIFCHEHMGINHNYLCAVCREGSAVLDCSVGILNPCWKCQEKGYVLVRKKSWIPSWVYEVWK